MGSLSDSTHLYAQNGDGGNFWMCAPCAFCPSHLRGIWGQLLLYGYRNCFLYRTWHSWSFGYMILGELFNICFLLGPLGTLSFLPHRVESCEDIGTVLYLASSMGTVLGCWVKSPLAHQF